MGRLFKTKSEIGICFRPPCGGQTNYQMFKSYLEALCFLLVKDLQVLLWSESNTRDNDDVLQC
jgi:hypothetical protein